MIDLKLDELISLSELARRLPATNGRRVNPATAYRWAVTGLHGHKLEVVRVGGRMLTTLSAYEAFNAAVANSRASKTSPISAPSRRATKRIQNAQEILRTAGIS